MNLEFVGTVIGLILTLFIYSYVVGDNPLYRLAVHLLVGVSAAYATVVAVDRILLPAIRNAVDGGTSTNPLLWLVPAALAVLLLLRYVRPISWLADGPVGALVGIGAAVAVVGVVAGTVLPQVAGAAQPGDFLSLLAALATVFALLYFHFTSTAPTNENTAPWKAGLSVMGRSILMITFGALFASALTTSIVILSERVTFYFDEVASFLGLIQ